METVKPEDWSLREQAAFVRNADAIIGPTGARLANILFCRPNTTVVILMAEHPQMIYWYWHKLACAVGCQVTYMMGTQLGPAPIDEIHADFYVNPQLIRNVSQGVR